MEEIFVFYHEIAHGNLGLSNSIAQFRLGQFYENREGVPQDLEQAKAWYLKALENGVPHSDTVYYMLAALHRGKLNDLHEGMSWLHLAAEGGHDYPALDRLAHCYANGIGVAQNDEEAKKWRHLAEQLSSREGLYMADNSEEIS
jgi:TPR repeat protein